MSQTTSQGPVVRVKPQPNIYTALLLVAIVVLIATLAITLYNLMAAPPAGYGLTFGEIFGKTPTP